MIRLPAWLPWSLLALYAVAGAVALMLATTAGLRLLGMTEAMVNFLPATILGLPWSLPLIMFPDGPVTLLAGLGICYALNVGVGLMLTRSAT
ncbi:MAG TPA: hypothetical protein VFF48_06285 [Brevundimonas sp.]|nr:hypothetical protein [Brevundimonas sp.]